MENNVNLFTIKNKEHLRLLRRISIYYKYGKHNGDRLLELGIDESLGYKYIRDFLNEYNLLNKMLFDFFVEKGLDLNQKMIEFCPSSFFAFQSTNEVPNIISIVKYQNPDDKYRNEIIGTIDKSGVHIQSDFDFDISNYDTILNNSIIDLLKNYSKEENMIKDVHGIKFAEENNINFYSGFAIRNESLLKDYMIEDFMKSIDKTSVGYDACVFEKRGDYTLGYIKNINE